MRKSIGYGLLLCIVAQTDCSAWQQNHLPTEIAVQTEAGFQRDSHQRRQPVQLLHPTEYSGGFEYTTYQPPIPPSAAFPIAPPSIRNNEGPDPRQVFDAPARQNPFLASDRNQPFLSRLSRTPDLFGDSFIPVNVSFTSVINNMSSNVDADLALAAGTRRFKNEHAKAFPTDRAFVYYQYFHNALDFQLSNGQTIDRSIDRLTVGWEKTFNDNQSSFELRIPMSGKQGVDTNAFQYSSDGVGNLVVSLKHLLAARENWALALGLATSVPSGSNLSGNLGNQTTFKFQNNAVHLLPYIGFQAVPDDQWFMHAFVQVDTPITPNDITVQSFGGPSQTIEYTDQVLLYLDAAIGRWFYRTDVEDALVTGVASVVELHYSTALERADTAGVGNTIRFGRSSNRLNVLNLTAGLHTELAKKWALRTAIVVPLRDDNDRLFDTEIQIALVRKLGRR